MIPGKRDARSEIRQSQKMSIQILRLYIIIPIPGQTSAHAPSEQSSPEGIVNINAMRVRGRQVAGISSETELSGQSWRTIQRKIGLPGAAQTTVHVWTSGI